jgi:vitamin B12 transporter
MFARKKSLAAALCLPVLSLNAITHTASAQEAPELSTIVVTATRQPTRVDELLSDLTVIEREEIEAAGPVSSITDLLARQPGLEIVTSGGPGAASSVYIRGSKGGHVLLLVDGARSGSATSGAPNWGYLPLQQIERIEILRGAASSLYGSDAIGGVIQVITRKGDGPLRANAELGFGSHHGSSASAGLSGSQQGWRYSLQIANNRTRGFSASNRLNSYSHNPDRDGYKNTSASGSLSYAFAPEQEIGISFLHADGWNDYDSGALSDMRQDVRASAFNLHSLNRLTDFWSSALRLGRSSDNTRNYRDHQDDGKFHTIQTEYQWQNDFRLPLGSALLALERLEEKISTSDDYDRKKRHVNSILAGWNGQIEAHRLQVNLRRDDNSQYGGKTTGFVAYGYQFAPAWRGHVSYGSAFKAPSFNDLYYPDPWMPGNPDLAPETARNREIALHYQRGAHHVSATAYQNDVKNLINWVYDANTSLYQPQNVNTARLRGLTLAYEGRLLGLEVKASADYQDPRDRDLDKFLTHRSRSHASLTLGHHYGPLDWNLEWQANSKRYRDTANRQELSGYALVNLQAAYRFARDWAVFARANNIFDRKYTLNHGYNTDGANVFLSIRYAPR